MPSKKIDKHTGQRPLPGVSEYDDALGDRPAGMPSLAVITTETAKLGLPDSDAAHLYDTWLVSGFKTARGAKILNWTAAIRIWHRNKYFPSQKRAFRAPTKDEEQEQLAKMRRLKNDHS